MTVAIKEPLVAVSGEEWRKLNDEIQSLKKFVGEYLNTMEGIDDSDESFLSDEHRREYVEAAKFMLDKYGRINNRIRQMEEALDKLPY
jgi:hypothetical protein